MALTGNLTSCHTAPRDLELFATWTCGSDLELATAMIAAGVTSPADFTKTTQLFFDFAVTNRFLLN